MTATSDLSKFTLSEALYPYSWPTYAGISTDQLVLSDSVLLEDFFTLSTSHLLKLQRHYSILTCGLQRPDKHCWLQPASAIYVSIVRGSLLRLQDLVPRCRRQLQPHYLQYWINS